MLEYRKEIVHAAELIVSNKRMTQSNDDAGKGMWLFFCKSRTSHEELGTLTERENRNRSPSNVHILYQTCTHAGLYANTAGSLIKFFLKATQYYADTIYINVI